MPKFRVLAEQSDLYEIYVTARNEKEALRKAEEADLDEFELFDTRSVREITIINNSVERI